MKVKESFNSENFQNVFRRISMLARLFCGELANNDTGS